MKKLISALCALMMLSCSMTTLLTTAEEDTTAYIVAGRYTLEESHAVTEDNLVYCSLKTAKDAWSFPVNTVPDAGACEMSALLNAVLNMYPDAVFSVWIVPGGSDGSFAEERKQFAEEHTADGKTYAEYLIDTQALVEAYEACETLTQEEIQAVRTAYRIQNECRKYYVSLISAELEGEYNRLKETGLELLEARPGYYSCQAYATAEQLRNFSVNPELGYRLSLASVLEYDPEEEAKHTFSHTPADLRDYENQYGIINNTAYSTCVDYYDGNVTDDMITEAYVPNAGTFDYSSLVGGIATALPDVRIGAVIQPYGWEEAYTAEKEQFLHEHDIDGRTYAEIMEEFYALDASGGTVSKELGNQVHQIVLEESACLNQFVRTDTELEPERLKENGIEVTNVINGRIYATMTAEQLQDFPVNQAFGYLIGLASAPGDVVTDGNVNILDVIGINKAILGKENLTDMQMNSADVNKDGTPDAEDSLNVMKYIVGLTGSLS